MLRFVIVLLMVFQYLLKHIQQKQFRQYEEVEIQALLKKY